MDALKLPKKIAIIGAGSWGTALAAHAARQGLSVTIWAHREEVVDQINLKHENPAFLTGLKLPSGIRAVSDIKAALTDQKLVLVVVPSHIMRAIAAQMAPVLPPETVVISASKGIEDESSATMVQILEEELPVCFGLELGAISGPSFAMEVALGLPTGVTLAMHSHSLAQSVQVFLSTPVFRIYTSLDRVGVELGGALKNIYAIAAGICDGFSLGANARAAMLSRALGEMSRMAVALGANPMTLMGLSGMGDLILTATGRLSRNRQVGLRLGAGEKLKQILAGRRDIAEGIRNARSVYNMALRYQVEMPMAREVYRIIYEAKEPRQGMVDLLTRPLKDELDLNH
ncbi:MAG: NAD(P)-dependent glycerol-3-phosphate dehydrogenase [Candidatus Adiutrix intracellularis]|jgi:glycerol-3-phosphate dehydrogenase (NAD(P)+)|nr:NAD(P)-dependent glycerol-3-phosphate dehydrogenase [Candidatus Adiutrix intracellularis]